VAVISEPTVHAVQRGDGALGVVAPVLTVASVPAGHVYVRHLAARRGGDGVHRLPDPRPPGPLTDAQQWWPPAMLHPDWVRANADAFAIFHVHFGFDALSADELAAVLDELDRQGKPLVYTVHDLRNPHHATRAAHDAHLDLLVPRADALITLTDGAAEEIYRRWGRLPSVLAHPHVVPFARMRPRRRGNPERFVVGVHAKSVRPSMAPGPVVAALLPLVSELRGLELVVDVHSDVADPDGARHDAQLMATLNAAVQAGAIRLAVHDCYTDDELWDYLERLDLSVLPYRFGTHSGWLEACHDLGTAVLAPSCGYYAEQRPCLTYQHDDDTLDAPSLRAAVRFAYANRPRWQATPDERLRERDRIAAAHRRLYAGLLR
jgi:hypothetical protein